MRFRLTFDPLWWTILLSVILSSLLLFSLAHSDIGTKDFPKTYIYVNPVNNLSIVVNEKEKVIFFGDVDDSAARFCNSEESFYCFSDFFDFVVPKDKSRLDSPWNYKSNYSFEFKGAFEGERSLYALGEQINTIRIESKQADNIKIEFLYSYVNGLVAIIFDQNNKYTVYISSDICGFGAAKECKDIWLEKVKSRTKQGKGRKGRQHIEAAPNE